jgi:hypothetical protein
MNLCGRCKTPASFHTTPPSAAPCVGNSPTTDIWQVTAPRCQDWQDPSNKTGTNRALQLLLSLPERRNGRCLEIITADIWGQTHQIRCLPHYLPHPLDCHPPHPADMPTRPVPANEGTSPDSLTSCHVVLLEDLLPSSLITPAHIPDFIRHLEPRFVGHSNARRCYSSIKKDSNREMEVLHIQ